MKILIWAMARALGDGITSSGYPKEIKKIYPDAQLDIIATRAHIAAIKNNPHIDNIYTFNTYDKPFSRITRTKIYINPLFHIKNLLKLRKQKYDIIIDVDSSYKWSNLFMIKFIMGKNYKQENRILSGKYRKNNKYKYDENFLLKTYTHLFGDTQSGGGHSAFSVLDKDIDSKIKYDIYIQEDNLKKAENYFNSITNNKKIIFNGDGSDKSISKEKITDTLKTILNTFPEYHIFILGYDGYLQKYTEILNNISSERLHITYKTSVEDIKALIKYADLLISIDTSLIHIASALGTNVCEIVSYGKKGNFVGKPKYVDYIICESKTNEFNLDLYDNNEVIDAVKKLI